MKYEILTRDNYGLGKRTGKVFVEQIWPNGWIEFGTTEESAFKFKLGAGQYFRDQTMDKFFQPDLWKVEQRTDAEE